MWRTAACRCDSSLKKQQRTGSVNSYRFQTTREVTLSALFKRQLSGSQLSSRWDKNVLSFKPFCSTGAVHQFSHLHSRGDKGLAGKFIFASRRTVLLSLYQPEMKRDCTKAPRIIIHRSRWTGLIKTGTNKGLLLRSLLAEAAGPARSHPPTPTLLNPILCYRLGKSIWSKSQARREMLKCCNTFWRHKWNQILINSPSMPRFNAWWISPPLIDKKRGNDLTW